jgi:hypothetical protein
MLGRTLLTCVCKCRHEFNNTQSDRSVCFVVVVVVAATAVAV